MKKYVTPFNLTQLLETPVIKARTNITLPFQINQANQLQGSTQTHPIYFTIR